MLLDQKIDYYLEKLKSEEPDERLEAINAIDEIPLTDSIAKELCSLVIDPDYGIRNSIADKLKESNIPAVPLNLVKYISYPDLAVKNLAGDILLGLGSLSIDPMLDYLEKGDDDDKKFIVDILGLIGNVRIENKIIELLNATENDNIVLSCIEALGNIKSEKSVSYLVSFYTVSEVFRPSIIEALGKTGVKDSLDFILHKYEEEESELIKFAVIESLGLIGDQKTFFFLLSELNEASEILIGPIINSIYNLKTRFGFDIPFDERIKNHVLKIITESGSEYRKIAACLLSVFNDKEILTAYAKIIGNEPETDKIILNNFNDNPSVFLSLIPEALEQKPENITAILKTLRDLIQLRKTEISVFITPIQLRDIIDSLSAYLKDSNEEVRILSLELLFLIDKDTAVLFFDDAADDQNYWNRLKLLEMLDETPNTKTDEILGKLLKDSEEMIRERAQYFLLSRNVKQVEN